jgi:hypothetical protein
LNTRTIITNGDFAAQALAAHFPEADILIWRDVLVEGPVPGNLEGEQLNVLRSAYIAYAFGMDLADVAADFTRRDEKLGAIPADSRVELWFETDLHDQLQLVQILSEMRRRNLRFDLHFVLTAPPLNRSNIDAMAKDLREVTPEQNETAQAIWKSFRATSPIALLEIAKISGPLPEASAAIARLFEEFPSSDGLGRVEREALHAIEAGHNTPNLAFGAYAAGEPVPFLGDLGFFNRLDGLAFGKKPLITGLPEGGISKACREKNSIDYAQTEIALTETGKKVLRSEADRLDHCAINRWIGGVNLKAGNIWRYDPERKAFTAPD